MAIKFTCLLYNFADEIMVLVVKKSKIPLFLQN